MHRSFIWLTVGVAAVLLLPALAMDGMFMDGMLYSAVAHNQANGFGSFWFPKYSPIGLAGLETFHEQPPLGFGLQALWFRIFGPSFWVERAYSLLMALITGGLIVAIWKAWNSDRTEIRGLAWFPVLLWIIIPTAHWCYHNNMMENTMGVFTMAAVLFAVKASLYRSWIFYVFGGSMVFLATLTKGLPGAFPIATPFLIMLVTDGKILRGFGGSLIMLMTLVAGYGLLLLNEEARRALEIYVNKRLLQRIAEDPTVDDRWATLEMLFTNLIGPLIILALILVLARKYRSSIGLQHLKPAIAMMLVAFSGILPLMLTMVQKSFYMAAALPCMALALALFGAPYLVRLLDRIGSKERVMLGVKITGMVLSIGAIAAAIIMFGKPLRDGDMLHDIDRVGSVVPEWRMVGAPYDTWNEWNLQTYLMRRHFIPLVPENGEQQWLLQPKGAAPPADHRSIELSTRRYDLYERISQR